MKALYEAKCSCRAAILESLFDDAKHKRSELRSAFDIARENIEEVWRVDVKRSKRLIVAAKVDR
jgi:hypothetical protein